MTDRDTDLMRQALGTIEDLMIWADKDMDGWTNSYEAKETAAMADALRARLAEPVQPVAVPDGYALVPVEPTPEMIEAGNRARLYREHGSLEDPDVAQRRTFNSQQAWAAMLAAAGVRHE